MNNDDRKKMVQSIQRIAAKLRAVTDSRPLLQELRAVADEYSAKEAKDLDKPKPPPAPRVEEGGINRMTPESTNSSKKKGASKE